ncbi:MAG: hypothetical protein Q4D19_04455 [Lautropia sp.]|nr:hypothetical protein [Lautropia sp.]
MQDKRYLQFVSNSPKGGRPILWPVHVWPVRYSNVGAHELNLFQVSILALIHAGCRENGEMAELLCLDKNLIAFIIANQLIPDGLMTSRGVLTQKGEDLLCGMSDSREERHRLGYAYQDGVTGEWLPRLSDDLNEIEPERLSDGGFPVFVMNRDSGREVRPFVQRFVESVSEPNTHALKDALDKYWEDKRRASDRGGYASLSAASGSVTLMDSRPYEAWLWTWVIRDPTGRSPWLVADPFGLRDAVSWLRMPLKEQISENSGLAKYVAGVLQESVPEEVSAEQWLRNLEADAGMEILANHAWVSKNAKMTEYLASVLRTRIKIESSGTPFREDCASLLIEAHNLAESLLQWVLRAYPVQLSRLPGAGRYGGWGAEKAKAYLQELDLPCVDEHVLKRLESQRLGAIRNAVSSGESPLKALLYACLLATVDHDDHPMALIGANDLALTRLLDMADARNRGAGHAGAGTIRKDEALGYADFVVNWMELFKGYLGNG